MSAASHLNVYWQQHYLRFKVDVKNVNVFIVGLLFYLLLFSVDYIVSFQVTSRHNVQP